MAMKVVLELWLGTLVFYRQVQKTGQFKTMIWEPKKTQSHALQDINKKYVAWNGHMMICKLLLAAMTTSLWFGLLMLRVGPNLCGNSKATKLLSKLSHGHLIRRVSLWVAVVRKTGVSGFGILFMATKHKASKPTLKSVTWCSVRTWMS